MSLTINNQAVERSIPLCLKEADESDYPIPYLSSILFGDAAGQDWIGNSIAQNERNRNAGTKAEVYEVSKFNRGTTRTLHRMPLAEAILYTSLARHFGVHSQRLQNGISYSFKPNLSSGPEMWDERKPRQRWKDFREALQQQSLQNECFQRADIKTFFNGIQHTPLLEAIEANYEDRFCGKQIVLDTLSGKLLNLLSGWFPNTGVGLPQGTAASFFFAEILLLKVDYAIENPKFRASRFVDDYFLFGPTESNLAWQNEQIETLLSELGLTFNVTKGEIGACKTLMDRLTHFENTKRRFKEATAKLGFGSNSAKIRVALDLLCEEFHDYDIDSYCVNYIVAIIPNNINLVERIPDALLQDLLKCFDDHSLRAANAIHTWLPIFTCAIERGEVQELFGKIVLEKTDMLDTDLAFCYGIFSLAKSIHNQSLQHTLRERFERDASIYVSNWSGSVAAKIGKSLRAAQRHGNGNQLLMDVFLRKNHYHEMRRYTAVAATSLSERQRQEFFAAQLSTCICPEERFVLDYLSQYDEQEVSSLGTALVTHPDGQRRPRKSGY